MGRVCSVCGSIIGENDAFCTGCGTPVPPENTASANPEPTVADNTADSVNNQASAPQNGNPYSQNIDAMPKNTAPNSAPTQNTAPQNTYAQSAPQQNETTILNPSFQQNYQQTYSDPYSNPTQGSFYGNSAYSSAPEKKDPIGLGVAGLIVGILALLTSCCFGGYLFGLIGFILGLIFTIKAKKKGLGIGALITSILAFIISLVMTIVALSTPSMISDALRDAGIDTSELEQLINEYENENGNGNGYISNEGIEVTGTNQILVGRNLITLTSSPSNFILPKTGTGHDYNENHLSSIWNEGIDPGDYFLLAVEDDYGNEFYAYYENTGSSTVYDTTDLTITGINVDSYSFDSAPTAVVYGGVELGMSKSEIKNLIGEPDDYNEAGWEVYNSADGYSVLALEYDNDVCVGVDLTVYP